MTGCRFRLWCAWKDTHRCALRGCFTRSFVLGKGTWTDRALQSTQCGKLDRYPVAGPRIVRADECQRQISYL